MAMDDSMMDELVSRVSELIESAAWSSLDPPTHADAAWEAHSDGARLLVVAWTEHVHDSDKTFKYADGTAVLDCNTVVRMTPEQSKRAAERAQEQTDVIS
jgi:hypothetical protein